ncbi:hypothetical protein E2C01_063688 [Portunus trituberculatus]|uniref:Uncharacterized protein n=1 Tax=Portunus trituberculatus TaxID=210409 RepID=A0A5B7HH18_PORTR|nr:hypothetical protein [Portunus trituberculatus]
MLTSRGRRSPAGARGASRRAVPCPDTDAGAAASAGLECSGRYFPERQACCVRRSVSLGSPCGVWAAGRFRALLTCPAPHLQVTAAPGYGKRWGRGRGSAGRRSEKSRPLRDVRLALVSSRVCRAGHGAGVGRGRDLRPRHTPACCWRCSLNESRFT